MFNMATQLSITFGIFALASFLPLPLSSSVGDVSVSQLRPFPFKCRARRILSEWIFDRQIFSQTSWMKILILDLGQEMFYKSWIILMITTVKGNGAGYWRGEIQSRILFFATAAHPCPAGELELFLIRFRPCFLLEMVLNSSEIWNGDSMGRET